MRGAKRIAAAAMSFFVMIGCLPGGAVHAASAKGDWPQFLGRPEAQGTAEAKTPRSAGELSLRWELRQEGVTINAGGMDWRNMPGTPVIADNYVYFYRSGYLRKAELATGKEVAKAQVYKNVQNQFFAYLAYYDGKIFMSCQTNDMGDVETEGCFLRAFDAETLTQLYATESFGTSTKLLETPLICHDGYIVTGVYGRNGAYVGFTTEDEDTSTGTEIKKQAWIIEPESRMGFLGNGAAFTGNYCYFALDDKLYQVEYKTGKYTTVSLGEGYASKSTMVYSPETKRLYAAANHPTEGTSIQSYGVKSDGSLDAADVIEWTSKTKGGATQSAPVICSGRLYIGGGGSHGGSAETFHVLDAETMEEQYSVPVMSKGTAAVSTGYADADNNQQVYIYMVPYAPVKDKTESELWIIKDSQGQKTADYEIAAPVGHPEYCYQSIAIGPDGSLVWFNDSGYLYCFEADENSKGFRSSAFSDLEGHWADSAVNYLAVRRLVSGTSEGVYSPDGSVTRAEFLQMLYNLSGDRAKREEPGFGDVKGQWFSKAVSWAVEEGIASGTSKDSFSPDQLISRQDMAVMMNNYMKAEENTVKAGTLSFADAESISPYAREAAARMRAAELMKGTPAAGGAYLFQPQAAATRGEAAAILASYLQNYGETEKN